MTAGPAARRPRVPVPVAGRAVRVLRRMAAVGLLALPIAGCGGGNVFDLGVGTCFQDAEGEVSQVEVVDCDQPHDHEVFATFELEDGDFPGQEAIDDAVADGCFGEAFEDYIGQPYATSEVEVFPITPTPASWEDADDREVACVAWLPEERVEGSLRGTAR